MRITTIFLALLLLPFFIGCTTQENPFGVVYLEGIVTLDGVPCDGVGVTLIPVDSDSALLSAGGYTDTRGKFTVTAGASPAGSGAQPGQYYITFMKYEVPEAPPGQPQPPTIHHVPAKYADPMNSGIEPITVSDKRSENKFTFALTSE